MKNEKGADKSRKGNGPFARGSHFSQSPFLQSLLYKAAAWLGLACFVLVCFVLCHPSPSSLSSCSCRLKPPSTAFRQYLAQTPEHLH